MSPSTGFPELLTSWLGAQRWFAGKGRAPQLRRIGGWELPATGVRITTHLIMDDSGSLPTLYQVPVTERAEPLEGAGHALIAALED
jgi:Maltokinase N-terminal cap domain